MRNSISFSDAVTAQDATRGDPYAREVQGPVEILKAISSVMLDLASRQIHPFYKNIQSVRNPFSHHIITIEKVMAKTYGTFITTFVLYGSFWDIKFHKIPSLSRTVRGMKKVWGEASNFVFFMENYHGDSVADSARNRHVARIARIWNYGFKSQDKRTLKIPRRAWK